MLTVTGMTPMSKCFADQAVVEGINTLGFNVPAGAQPGYTVESLPLWL